MRHSSHSNSTHGNSRIGQSSLTKESTNSLTRMESKAVAGSPNSNTGLWWRWSHGKSGTTASSSHVGGHHDVNSKLPASPSTARWQKRATRMSNDDNTSVSSNWWSLTSDTGASSSSLNLFSASTRSQPSVPPKKKTPASYRDGNRKKKTLGSASSSTFFFSTRDDNTAVSSEISWSMGKTKRPAHRKDKKNAKMISSVLSNSRGGLYRKNNVQLMPEVNEDSEKSEANVFTLPTQQSKLGQSSLRGSTFASSTEIPKFDFSKSVSSTSASSISKSPSFTFQSLPSVDPLVDCARAVLQDCIRKRKMEQKNARKRSIESSMNGELLESKELGWYHDSVSKHKESGVFSPGSSSSSDDELSQLSSIGPPFSMEKSEWECESKVAKEEMYRQILLGDYDLSSSPEYRCVSPIIEEKGLPIEIRYQLPLALGTANETSKECTICQLRYGIGDHIVTLPCQHFFHACCVDKWLWNHTSCPLCRAEVSFDQETEVSNTKHNFTECSPIDQERIRRQMRSSSQYAGFRPVVPVEVDQLELEVSRMAIDEDSEDVRSYLVRPTPHLATNVQDNCSDNW